MVGRREKFLNSRRSTMAKTVDLGDSYLIVSALKVFLLFLCFPFFFLLRKKVGGGACLPACLGPCQTFMMEVFVKIVNSFMPLTIFGKKLHHRGLARS